MTLDPAHSDLGFTLSPGAETRSELRQSRRMRWLANPATYAWGAAILTMLSAGTALLAPLLLDPAAFGSFALLTTLYQMAGKSDLGLSQLADRELTTGTANLERRGAEILQARWILGAIVILLIVPVAALIAHYSGTLDPLDTALAITGGTSGMIAGGPVTIFRAASQIWEFTASALILQAGMTAPRLAGLVFGGVTGCFAALLAWYGFFAIVLARPKLKTGLRLATVTAMISAAFPLFAFSTIWLLYLFANRWLSAFLSSPDELGLFSFGANLSFIAISTLGAISQVHYPRILHNIAQSPRGACSDLVVREANRLAIILAVAIGPALLFAHPIMAFAFPHFEEGTEAAILMAVATIPLCVVAWIIPIAIALSKRPWWDSLTTFLPPLILLAGLMALGTIESGITGQAFGCIVSAFVLVMLVIWLLQRQGVLTTRGALRIGGFQTVIVAGYSMLGAALISNPILTLDDFGHLFEKSAASKPALVIPKEWTLIFDENFDTLRLKEDHPEGIWEPHYSYGQRTNETNNEMQYYVDPRPDRDPPEFVSYYPFTTTKGILTIRAQPLPAALRGKGQGLEYTSGMLTTFQTFAFQYGYAEIRAKIPKGQGLWPAFWMLPTDRTWPPEIDVLEALGHETSQYYATLHSRQFGSKSKIMNAFPTPDLSEGFHTYGVKWTSEEIVWYFDGRRMVSVPTPSDMHKPMYLLANLAIGGGWAGPPDATTRFPADYQIDRIRVYGMQPKRPVSRTHF